MKHIVFFPSCLKWAAVWINQMILMWPCLLFFWIGKSVLSVDALEKMMEDPTVQKMVFP
jgi:hypothetical protein